MTPHNELRLLPWSGPEGNPCYLSTAGSGFLSHLADTTEAMQLDTAAELLEHAREVLGYGEKEPNELQLIALDMMGALCDVLRVAISRGHRLALTEPPACE